ncbi:MAG: HTH domain-containing protein [Chloroflexota bacterium]|nr:HTH domain-containing protein [Chloroflexota bacterium]
MEDETHQANGTLERSLRSERDRLQQTIKQLRQEIEAKEAEYRANEERLVHVKALLSTEPPAISKRSRRPHGAPSPSTPTPKLLDMVEEVLRERSGEPMHYRDLADELVRRGAVIRGQDPAAALVSRMTQDDNRRAEGERRFIRPASKGFYALREDYPNARNVGTRRRGKAESKKNSQ